VRQLALRHVDEVVDFLENTALSVAHRGRFTLGSGLLTKLLHLVYSLRIRRKSLLHTQSSALTSKGVHTVNEFRADSLRPLRAHKSFAARETNRSTGARNSVHVPAGSVPRHNAALCEPLLAKLNLLQFRKSRDDASNLPVNGHDTVVVDSVGHELDRVSGDLLDLVPDLLDTVLHTREGFNSLLLHVVPDIDNRITGTLSSRDDLFPEIAELASDVRNPSGHGLVDRVFHVGE